MSKKYTINRIGATREVLKEWCKNLQIKYTGQILGDALEYLMCYEDWSKFDEQTTKNVASSFINEVASGNFIDHMVSQDLANAMVSLLNNRAQALNIDKVYRANHIQGLYWVVRAY